MTAERGKNIVVSPKAKRAVLSIKTWSGLPESKITERILEFVADLERLGEPGIDMQGAIVGALPRSRRPEFAKRLLETMANESDAALARQIVDEAVENTPPDGQARGGKRRRQA